MQFGKKDVHIGRGGALVEGDFEALSEREITVSRSAEAWHLKKLNTDMDGVEIVQDFDRFRVDELANTEDTDVLNVASATPTCHLLPVLGEVPHWYLTVRSRELFNEGLPVIDVSQRDGRVEEVLLGFGEGGSVNLFWWEVGAEDLSVDLITELWCELVEEWACHGMNARVTITYIQVLWKVLFEYSSRKSFELCNIDEAYSALRDATLLADVRAWKRFPLLFALVLTAW